MARTDAAYVQGFLNPEDYDGRNLIPFIGTASRLVDRVEACASAKGQPMTADELKDMEAWLACHFYQMTDPGYTSRSTLDGSGSFRGQTTNRLEGTLYGQTALSLDHAGCLDPIVTGKSAGGTWLGKTQSAKLTYDQRN